MFRNSCYSLQHVFPSSQYSLLHGVGHVSAVRLVLCEDFVNGATRRTVAMELPTQQANWNFPPLSVGFPSYDAGLPSFQQTDFALLTEAALSLPNVTFSALVEEAAFPLESTELALSTEPALLGSLGPQAGFQPSEGESFGEYSSYPTGVENPYQPMPPSYIDHRPSPSPSPIPIPTKLQEHSVSINQTRNTGTHILGTQTSPSVSAAANGTAVLRMPMAEITVHSVKPSAKLRNAMTTEQKKLAVKERQNKKVTIEDDINELFVSIDQRCKELGEKHNRKARFFLDRIFNGGVKAVIGSKTSSFNAWAHFKCEQVNEGTYIMVFKFTWPQLIYL